MKRSFQRFTRAENSKSHYNKAYEHDLNQRIMDTWEPSDLAKTLAKFFLCAILILIAGAAALVVTQKFF